MQSAALFDVIWGSFVRYFRYVLSNLDARFDGNWGCDGDRDCFKKYPFLLGRSMPEWH